MPISRRTFLGAGAAAVLAGCRDGGPTGRALDATPTTTTTTTTPGTTTSTTSTTSTTVGSTPSGDGILVLLTLYGGNDALNTVVPFTDSRYLEARGPLAVDPAGVLDLGDGYGLHPALAGTKALWDAGRLAVVHGVGFPGLDRSHFHCMDVWQAGQEDELTTGWLGRWLDDVGTDPLDAVAVGRRLPLAMRGATRSAAVVPVGPFELPGDDRLRRLMVDLAVADPSRPPLAAMVAASTADLLAVVDTVGPLLAGSSESEADEGGVGGSAAAEAGGLGGQLAVVASLIESGLPTKAYGVDLGGFDTHANQAATHEALLTELDGALSGFLERMGSRPVTVAVYSEFGRRVKANGSSGTDHGGAGTLLLAGQVRPGFHGEPSPLDRLDGGDLMTTVDFRSVYGGLLEGVLGMPAADVLPGAPAPLLVV